MGSEAQCAVPRGLAEARVPNSSAEVCGRPLGSLFLTPVSVIHRRGAWPRGASPQVGKEGTSFRMF